MGFLAFRAAATRRPLNVRRAAIFAASLTALIPGTSREAIASQGCNAVNAGAFNLSATAAANGMFAVGDQLSFTITATISVYIFSGSLSPGGSGSSSATVNFTVSSAGSGQLALFPGEAGSISSTGTCVAAPSPLTLTSTASATTQMGQTYSQTNVGSGGTTPYTYSVSAGTLPAGTTLNTSTGTVSGTPTAAGAFSYTIKVTDSGSPAQTASNTATGTIGVATTTTTLTSSPNPSSYTQPVAFTATVAGSSPTGTVTFFDGATQIGTGTVSSGKATFTTSSLAIGSHSITAKYSGDANNVASISAALTQTVNVPTNSIKLRQMQVSVTPMIAQDIRPSHRRRH